MDFDLIKLYSDKLHWHLTEELQQEAIEWLVEYIPRDQLALMFTMGRKSSFQNAVKVVETIGYPNNEAAFPSMVELFQDINWPGAEEAVLYFQTLEKAIVVPYIEAGGKQAMVEHDHQWLWFLYAVCVRLMIERADFQDGAVFDAMKERHEND